MAHREKPGIDLGSPPRPAARRIATNTVPDAVKLNLIKRNGDRTAGGRGRGGGREGGKGGGEGAGRNEQERTGTHGTCKVKERQNYIRSVALGSNGEYGGHVDLR